MSKLACIFIAILLCGRAVQGQSSFISNSDFEGTISSSNWANFVSPWFVFTTGTQGHNFSTRYAFFGVGSDGSTNNPNANGTFYQTIAVPTNVTALTLNYWLQITSTDTSGTAHDYLFAEIQNGSGGVLYTAEFNTNTFTPKGSWVQRTINLQSAHAGQTIRVAFHGVTNSDSFKTVFRIDDVTLTPTYAPPFAQTNSASNVTSNSATLNGTVNPNGTSTSAYFEYGPTTSYGNSTPSVGTGSGNSNSPTQSVLTALAPNATFHYRTVATNTYGQTTRGTDVSFTTPQATGTVTLQVNGSDGSSLALSEMNAVLLFPGAGGASVARKQPPSANPVNFTSMGYANYYLSVFCWDMLAAQSTVFSHASATTNHTLTTYPKRPLSVVAFRSDGSTTMESMTILIDSYNGETSHWTERARGTTNSFGIYTVDAWPTTQTGEKYRVTVMNGSTQVGSDANVTVPNTSGGRTMGVTTSVPLSTPFVTVTAPSSGSSFQVGTPVNITWTLSGTGTQVSYFKVAILDNGVEDASLNFFASLGSSPFSWTPQSSFVRNNLTARVRALDANGNILAAAISPSFSTTSSGSLVARATAPEKVYLNSPATFSSAGSTPVPGRPITSYAWEFYVGSTQVGTANVAAPTFTFSWGKLGSARVTIGDGFTTSTKTVEFALLGTGNPTNTDSGSSVDPVNTATGNFVMSPTLLEVHARALPFVFQAYYNSKAFQPGDTTPGPLGYGWTHSFETRISEPVYQDGVLSVIITFGDGHPETYRFENAVWNADSGNYNKLTRADNGIFTLITPNQIKHQFDANGRLTAIIDRNGNPLSVVWNATPSRITSVILPGGPDINGNPRKIDFAYDAAGHLSKLTDPINRTVEFTVDAAHNLTAIKNPRGYSSTYTYDALHQMLTGTDPRTNRFVRNVYQDRVVIEQYDVDDHKTTFEYPFTAGSTIDFTRITRKAASGDEITEDHHNAKLQLLERKVWLAATTSLSTKAEYYDNGDRKAVIDRNGNRTSFEYNNDGDVTKVTFADTSTISMTYSPYHDLLTKTNQVSIIEKREYDDPAKGNLIALTFPFDAADTAKYRRTFAVDAFGQTTAATDANNRTTHAYFNEWGENWKIEDAETPPNAKVFDLDGIGRKTGVTDERGNHTTFTLNENCGAEVITLTALPAPIGVTQIKQTFDENDNLTSVEDPLNRFTSTEFDNQDRPCKVKNHNLATITTEFDELGRAVRVQDPKLHYSHRVYDLAGRLTEARDQMGRKHVFTHDANGNVLTDIDDDGVKVETVWDVMNRPIKQRRYTSPTAYDETITHYNLLGQTDWTEDAASHVNHNRTYFYYNDAGQLIRMVEPAINGIAQEFTWTYDFEGNLLSATHPTPTGPKTRYQTWTARNQIATRTDENGQIERFFYNPVGKLDHFINANSQTIAFVYDALNRTSTIDYPGSAVDTQFTYDAAGQLIFMDDALGRTTWTYTALGQIETVTDPFGKSLAYHYDVNGNRDTVTYPGGKEAHYAFDDANALLSVTDWQTRTISRSLTAAGRVATITYPNGITTTVGHDAAGRENDIQHQKGVAVPFIHFGYTFDPKGQIQEVTPTIHPLTKQAFTAASSTYTYDTANQLASIDGITVTHDNQGNVLTGKLSPLSTGTDTLTWDIEGRLTAATIAGVTSTSSYDGQGHRLQTTHGSTTMRYVTDTTGSLAQVMAETDGSGTITAYYLYLGGLAARILPNGDLSCYHTDRAGNVLALTDSGGSTTDLNGTELRHV